MSDFLTKNKPAWQELEKLVARGRRAIGRMSPEELRRLDVLYRITTVHLAQVKTRTSDARLMVYLNQLVASAHSLIYLPPRRSVFAGALKFFAEGFPRMIVRTWRYHAVSVLLLLAGCVISYVAARNDPLAAYALLPASESRLPGSTQEQLLDVLRSGRDQGDGEKFVFASFLFSHNLRVGILSMAVGILAAVPTVFLILYNGMILGAFTAVHHGAGIYAEYWAWILPHGITELFAIALCGGVGLMLGHAVVSPGLLTRTESLRRTGIEAAKMAGGAAAMLTFAAVIESYLRQSHLSTNSRFLFAGGSAIFWIAYLVHGYLRERAESTPALIESILEST
ncbi:MAG: stage II sporulation protein M [Planctomycetota bacterium]